MWRSKPDGSEKQGVPESKKIVLAFGRNGGSGASKSEAKAIVEAAHNSGHWFFCGCKKGAVLVPVKGTHVRRKTPNSTAHDEDCPFAVEPDEQVFVVRSLRPHSPDKAFSLLREGNPPSDKLEPGVTKASYSTRRPGLARLLVSLAEASIIQRQGASNQRLGNQFSSLKEQAKKFRLAPKVRVWDMLCPDTDRYDGFIRDFDTRSNALTWPSGIRPHGILIDTIKGVSNNNLVCGDDSSKPVLGNISIFGRAEAPVNPWSTYIAIGLIGRLPSCKEPSLLRAYIHPCVSPGNLMLVDSNYERETLKYIRELQVEYREKIEIHVRKPLTDIGTRTISDTITDEEAAKDVEINGAPKVLVPDFILCFPQFSNGIGDIIVETLGFSWPSYRNDKDVTVPAMRAALGGIPAIPHDFHFPKDTKQAERNDQFKQVLRTLIEERIRKLRY